MKYFIFSLFFIFSNQAFSSDWNSPFQPFDATKGRIYKKPISIEWKTADNINKACEEASIKYGNNGFNGDNMDACAFWWGHKCVIITKKQPNMHDVGHEVRHCFYGAWH